jgi:DNA-binding NarL/FixJ family response regulator
MLRILVADDHPIFRKGIVDGLKRMDTVCEVDQVSNGEEVLEFLKNRLCDLIIMDINMPKLNGIETTKIVRTQYPHIKIIGLSMFDDIFHVTNMVEAGANGYSTKYLDLKDLFSMIDIVLKEGFYISKDVSLWLSKDYQHSAGKGFKEAEPLTEREIEILVLLCGQLSSKDIAEKLNISFRTVQTHRQNITEKTGAINTVGLVLYAIEKGHILMAK